MFVYYAYFFSLFLCFVACLVQFAIACQGREPGGIGFENDLQKKLALLFFCLYAGSNFFAELPSYVLFPGQNNLVAYCLNIIIGSFSLFAFFFMVLKTRLMLYSGGVGWIFLTVLLIVSKFELTSIIVAEYFGTMTIISSVFLFRVLTQPVYQRNRFLIRMGILSVCYFAIASITISINFIPVTGFTFRIDELTRLTSIWSNFIYYFLFAVLCIQNIIRI